ncbi:MAG: hypothetical protein AAGF78_09815 [Pseudomonadota bacterium]
MRVAAWVTLGLAILFALAPFVADPFAGFESDMLPIPQDNAPIIPAGYAFSIWGVIYLWLLVSGIFGVVKRAEDPDWHRARVPLIPSLAVGAAWLFIANVSVLWATITIWIMLIFALAALYVTPSTDRLLIRGPVGLYAGWLSAASFVSLGVWLAGNFYVTDEVNWALILLPSATVLATLVMIIKPRVPEYGLAVTWAFAAIAIKNFAELDLWSVAFLATACATGMALITIRAYRLRRMIL